jgi:hypothetical protein
LDPPTSWIINTLTTSIISCKKNFEIPDVDIFLSQFCETGTARYGSSQGRSSSPGKGHMAAIFLGAAMV